MKRFFIISLLSLLYFEPGFVAAEKEDAPQFPNSKAITRIEGSSDEVYVFTSDGQKRPLRLEDRITRGPGEICVGGIIGSVGKGANVVVENVHVRGSISIKYGRQPLLTMSDSEPHGMTVKGNLSKVKAGSWAGEISGTAHFTKDLPPHTHASKRGNSILLLNEKGETLETLIGHVPSGGRVILNGVEIQEEGTERTPSLPENFFKDLDTEDLK